MEYFDYVWGTLLAVVCGGVFSLLGVVIGGLFVFRTKRDGYEPLLPPLKEKQEMQAYNLDDFEQDKQEEPVDFNIEQILAQRREEEENPAQRANRAFKEQMNG